jgi:long-chain acyl-CoA synthetase
LSASLIDAAVQSAITVIYASPFHVALLAGDTSQRPLEHLRLAVSTADRLTRDVADRFAARFSQPVVQALGIIEVGIAVMNRAAAADKPGALGRPLPNYDVWLRDETGKALQESSATNTGEICIRGPGLFDAYLDPWVPSSQVTDPDGFRTGDQGWFDADGDLHLTGRRVNRINMAGMKFFCEDIEQVIDEHPAVARSLVRARPHPKLGEIPVADIVLTEGGAEDQRASILAHCRRRLAAYMIPRQIRIVAALPMTATGKISRSGHPRR